MSDLVQLKNGELRSYKIKKQKLIKKVYGTRRITACCDCGLVHEYLIFIEKNKIKVIPWRLDKQTKKYRKTHKIKDLKNRKGEK